MLKKIQINNLTYHKTLGKSKLNNASRWKEIMKFRAEINEIV